RLSGHSLVLVTPGQVHGWPRWEGLRGTMVGFRSGFCGDGNSSPLIALPDAEAGPILRVDKGDARQLDQWMALLAQEFIARQPDWLSIVRHVLPLVLLFRRRLLDQHKPNGTPSRRATELVRRFNAALEREVSA